MEFARFRAKYRKKKEGRKFKIGDDIEFIMRLVVDEKLKTGMSLRPSDVAAEVELIHNIHGSIRMGLVH